jgi:hypothetical protein
VSRGRSKDQRRGPAAHDPPARADGIDGVDGVGGGRDGGGDGGDSDGDGDRDGDGGGASGGASGGGDSSGSCSDSGEEGKGGGGKGAGGKGAGGKGAGGDEAPTVALVAGRDDADPSDDAALLEGQDGSTPLKGQAIDWQALAWRSKRLANQEVDRAHLLDPHKRLPPYTPEAATLHKRLPPYGSR